MTKKSYVFRKGMVIGIIILFVGASVIPSISGNLLKNTIAQDRDINEKDIDIKNNNLNDEVHDWPMFHHDTMNTGYTDGKGNMLVPLMDWSFEIGDWVESSPALGDLDDDPQLEIVFGCFDHKVYCLDADGSEIWNYTTNGSVFSSPAIANGKVYIGSNDHDVYCLDAKNGNKIWSYTTEDRVWMSSPAIANGKVYIGSNDDNVYCLDAENGNKIWSYTTQDDVSSSPALGDIDNDGELEVFVGSKDDFVYCLDAENGNFIWKFETGGDVVSSPALGDIDNDDQLEVFVGSNDNYVYALNSIGKEKWKFETGDDVWSSPALGNIDDDDQLEVVVGSIDTFVYCLDAVGNGDGTTDLIWRFETGKDVQSSPALGDIDNDNQIEVVVGSHDKNLYVLDGKTGDEEWKFEADGWVDTSPALGDIDNDERLEIVFGTGDIIINAWGNVYVLDGDDTQNPPSVVITYPEEGDCVEGTIKINGTAYSYAGVLEQVKVKIGNEQWNTATGTTDWYYNWDTTKVADGLHTIYVKAKDDKDLEGDDFVSVIVDNNPPECGIEMPQEGFLYINDEKIMYIGIITIVVGKLTIEVKATDEGIGIDGVWIIINDEDYRCTQIGTSDYWKYIWDDPKFFRISTIYAKVKDKAGHECTTNKMGILEFF